MHPASPLSPASPSTLREPARRGGSARAEAVCLLLGLGLAMGPAAPAEAQPASPPEGGDPRPWIAAPELEHRYGEALERTERALAQGGPTAAALGLDYLRGHLLDHLGRRREAAEAYAQAIGASPPLALHSRFRMALDQERFGHPEVAAGLVASAVDGADSPALENEATRLLVRTLAQGGDCRLLGGIRRTRLAEANRRWLTLAAGDCALSGKTGQPDDARRLYLDLLRESVEDEPARLAAERLAHDDRPDPPDDVAELIGRAFHWHRLFERSRPLLESVAAGFGPDVTGTQFDLLYTLARGYFWQEDFTAAAASYGDLAQRTSDRHRRALALYQRARSLELAGDWLAATTGYRRAYRSDPSGRLADAALIAAMRIEWRTGDERSAGEVYDLLIAERRWIPVAARASLFLAASDLGQGRRDRAGRWIELAERAGSGVAPEAHYWRGRLAELDDQPAAAVRWYVRVLDHDLFHPLAQDARARLARPTLAKAALAEAARLAGSNRPEEWYDAWLLLGDRPPGPASLERLRRQLATDRASAAILSLAPVPVERWPLWKAPLAESEELLLALGIWEEGAGAVTRHFPLAQPDLAFTGTALLAEAGELRRAIFRAESLRRRAPRVEPPLLPTPLRRLLYPFAYSELLVDQALRRRVDPYLVAAIIREESRFDPRALSPAAARGLTQFVLPTARRVAAEVGLDPLSPDELYLPEVAVALGTAYLRELLDRFGGSAAAAVASYNAGEPQADLWRRHCFTTDDAEYFTKVSFNETRSYLERVLRGWAEYQDIYRERRTALPGRPVQ